MRHPQRAGLLVQGRPVQPEHLTAAHPVGKSQHDRRLKPVPGRSVYKLARLGYGERPALLRPDARRSRQGGGVSAHDALAHCLPERAAQLYRQPRPEYPDESCDELVRLSNLRPPGLGADKLARNLR